MTKIFASLSLLLMNLSALAQDGTLPPPTAAAKQPGTLEMLVPFIGMFAIMYFLMIRPQQKKMKEQQAMLGNLKSGDEVLTTSGIIGKVGDISEKTVTVEVDRNVKIRMLKSQIAQVMQPNQTT